MIPITNEDLELILSGPEQAKETVSRLGGHDSVVQRLRKILGTGLGLDLASPATPNARESVSQEQFPKLEPSIDRLRAMRRNEGLVIIRASGSPSAGDFIREVGMEEFGKMTDVEVDCWFDRVCEEFKNLKKVSAPISSRSISE